MEFGLDGEAEGSASGGSGGGGISSGDERKRVIVQCTTRWEASQGILKGSYKAECPGTLHLVLDNSFSYFR